MWVRADVAVDVDRVGRCAGSADVAGAASAGARPNRRARAALGAGLDLLGAGAAGVASVAARLCCEKSDGTNAAPSVGRSVGVARAPAVVAYRFGGAGAHRVASCVAGGGDDRRVVGCGQVAAVGQTASDARAQGAVGGCYRHGVGRCVKVRRATVG